MSGLYDIPLSGLKEGSHLYDFDIDRDFFEAYDNSEISKCEINITANLVKRSAHMELTIKVGGRVMIVCDRCLEDYWQEIESNNVLLVKYGDQWEEVDDEVVMIPYGESSFDLSQFIYEFAHLALPIQRVHPDDKNGESGCDPLMIEKLREHLPEPDNRTDPRWKELGKLRGGLEI
jgi:uncharacterized metal-binding protein YceD (DUF177 family)